MHIDHLATAIELEKVSANLDAFEQSQQLDVSVKDKFRTNRDTILGLADWHRDQAPETIDKEANKAALHASAEGILFS